MMPPRRRHAACAAMPLPRRHAACRRHAAAITSAADAMPPPMPLTRAMLARAQAQQRDGAGADGAARRRFCHCRLRDGDAAAILRCASAHEHDDAADMPPLFSPLLLLPMLTIFLRHLRRHFAVFLRHADFPLILPLFSMPPPLP